MAVSKNNLLFITAVLMFFVLCGCQKEPVDVPDDLVSDQMSSEKKENETIRVFQFNGSTYTVNNAYQVSIYSQELVEGGFYEVLADVTYLNGGIAGYVDFPQIDKIYDCRQISPLDMDLPSINDKNTGLSLIGDYGEGDVFLNEYGMMAVWKDGEWLYQYDKEEKNDEGKTICFRKDVSEETINEGIAQGVFVCEDYIVLP